MERPPKTKKINIELLLGLSATFLSFAALVVSIFQTKIAREQQQATVWPYLQTSGFYAPGKYNYSIGNNGVGPAIIKTVEWRSGDLIFHSTYDFVRNELLASA